MRSAARPHGIRTDGWFSVDGTIIGDGREWHQIRISTFPSRAAFVAATNDPERMEAFEARQETIADSYILGVRANANRLKASLPSA